MSQLICTYKYENVPFRKDKFPSRANAMQSNSVFIVVGVRYTSTEGDIGRCTHIRFGTNRIPSANQSFRTCYNIYLTVYDLRKAFSFCVKSSIIDEKSTRLKIRIKFFSFFTREIFDQYVCLYLRDVPPFKCFVIFLLFTYVCRFVCFKS